MAPRARSIETDSTLGLLAAELAERGFDLVLPFVADRGVLGETSAEPLETFGRERSLGLLVGNTRALHPIFFRRLAEEPDLFASPDPLDTYAMREIEGVLERVLHGEGMRYATRYAHDGTRGFLPIQRVALATGRLFLGESRLVIHPEYGPWIGLRAVITLDAEPPRLGDAVSPSCECAAHCAAHRLDLERKRSGSDQLFLRDHYLDFLAMRDACPIGRAHRYDEDAIVYHYTKDRAALERAVERQRRA